MAAKTFSSLGEWWCRLMHDEITWPVYGNYRCRRCNRLYPVPWEESAAGPARRRVVEIRRPQPQIAAA